GTSTIDPASAIAVDELAEILKNNSRLQIRILGYDVAGNNVTANKRAYAIKQELLNRGGDNNRIDAGGTTTTGKDAVSLKIISK
ncbi:MAG: OmpA family protein, partial [Spirosomaceae bacterium]|nr:OmpA family protein [Spirosomataceae bacterium]